MVVRDLCTELTIRSPSDFNINYVPDKIMMHNSRIFIVFEREHLSKD